MGVLISVVLPLALAAIMLSLGLGLTVDDFKRVLVRPFAFCVGAANQLVLVPIIAFLIIIVFGISAELAVGIMILSFCPGGVTSNMISKLAKGDVALSVSLTAVISLVSMITVPILVAWSLSRFMGADAPPISITSLAISMFLITALPVLIGVLIRHFATGFANKVEPVFSKIATVLFVIIVIAALASNWNLFIENLLVLGPALIVLNVLLIVLGAVIAKICGLSLNEVKTIAIETGIQNSTVGITLGTIVAANAAGFSAYSLPAAVYGITMYLVAAPAVAYFRGRAGA